MARPIDSVTSSVLKLQLAQRAVNSLVQELLDRAAADPFNESSQPDVRIRLSELRAEVDAAVDDLIDALARMGESSAEHDSS